MVYRSTAAVLGAILLAGCSATDRSSRPVAVAAAPSAPSYVWARNDGQRMSGNPELLAQGRADQEQCRVSATSGGALNQSAFVSCMQARGYNRRDV